MSRSTPPGGARARRSVARRSVAHLLPPFDGYPYLVTRIGHSALRHVAILPTTWSEERLLELARRQVVANQLDTCLAVGPRDAVYITTDGGEYRAAHVPTGLPVVERLRLAAHLPRTPEMAARRARLQAFAAAHAGPRYFVGDGLEGGRPATRDDLIRFVGLDGEACPAGTRSLSDVRRARRRLPRHAGRGQRRPDAAGRPGPLPLREPQPLRPLRRAARRATPERLSLRRGDRHGLLRRRLLRLQPPLPADPPALTAARAPR